LVVVVEQRKGAARAAAAAAAAQLEQRLVVRLAHALLAAGGGAAAAGAPAGPLLLLDHSARRSRARARGSRDADRDKSAQPLCVFRATRAEREARGCAMGCYWQTLGSRRRVCNCVLALWIRAARARPPVLPCLAPQPAAARRRPADDEARAR